jgi:hypothetical protein
MIRPMKAVGKQVPKMHRTSDLNFYESSYVANLYLSAVESVLANGFCAETSV